MCINTGIKGKWINVSGLSLIIIGVAASVALPTDFMNSSEALFARFVVSIPIIIFGMMITALGRIACLLENGAQSETPLLHLEKRAQTPEGDDHNLQVEDRLASLMASTLVLEEVTEKKSETVDVSKNAVAAKQEKTRAEKPADPAVKKALNVKAISEPAADMAVKEGEISGRKYRLFSDGSLEIDTNQSTIRFDSMEEFRVFIQNSENF